MTPRLDRYKLRHPRLCKHSFTEPDLSFTLHLTKNIHKWKTSEGNCCFAGTIDISDKNCCLTHDILICYQLNVDDPHEHKFALLKGIQHISREGFKSENLEKNSGQSNKKYSICLHVSVYFDLSNCYFMNPLLLPSEDRWNLLTNRIYYCFMFQRK